MACRMWAPRLAVVVFALLLAGCANLRLHNEARDLQGQAARKAWADVDLRAVVDAERTNLKTLLDAELETQDQVAAGIRDFRLSYMIRSQSVQAGLLDPLDERLRALVGSSAQLHDAQQAILAQRAADATQQQTARPLKALGLPVPSCKDLVGGKVPDAVAKWKEGRHGNNQIAAVDVTIDEMRKGCEAKPPMTDDVLHARLGGAVKQAWDEYQSSVAELAARRKDASDRKEAYAKAVQAYEAAASSPSAKPGLQDQVATAAQALNKAAKALESNAYAAKFIAEEKLKALDELTQSIIENQAGDAPAKDTPRSAAAAVLIPKLVDDASTAFAASKKPLALPLLIQRNHEQLNLEAARRDIDASETVVRLSRELVDAIFAQAEQLQLARDELTQGRVKPKLGTAFFDAFKGGTADEKEVLYSSAARYLDALGRLDAQRYRLEYQRIAACHERTLAYADVNLKQWEALIGATVNQAADFSAGGLKPETLGNLFNTLGIFYIGAGVNK